MFLTPLFSCVIGGASPSCPNSNSPGLRGAPKKPPGLQKQELSAAASAWFVINKSKAAPNRGKKTEEPVSKLKPSGDGAPAHSNQPISSNPNSQRSQIIKP